MSHTKTDPYRTDEFWIELMKINLAKTTISDGFRKRCEAIKKDCEHNLQEHRQDINLHYPNARKP